jgi:hypothetical protein
MLVQNSKIGFRLRRLSFALTALVLGATVLTPAPGAAEGVVETVKEKLAGEAAYLLGMESYVYGYPLVMMDVTREVLTAVPAPNDTGTAAPLNQFALMPTYVSPDFKNVVRISLNALWATASLDLGPEPLVLSVPDVGDRYYVMSIMDAWTNVFASFGKRTSGTGPGNFLIAGPGWDGDVPPDVRVVVHSPTRFAWLLGQTQANGPADFAAVRAIQANYKLTPLSAWGKPYTPPTQVPVASDVDLTTTPVDQVAAMDAGTFFNRLAVAMKDNPPAPEDWRRVEMLKLLGIEPGAPFDIAKADPAVAEALQRAIDSVNAQMQAGVASMKNVNGWIQPPNVGLYGTDYDLRAGIAYMGLGANKAEDTIYPTAYVDGDGKPFDSANKYVLHFDKDQLPPTNATWSVSIYQGNFYVPNAMNRYDIAPWMPLVYDTDGSLDIYIQAESPGAEKEANWLPTPPSGPFNLTIRNYWPKEAALNGSYATLPVRRVE